MDITKLLDAIRDAANLNTLRNREDAFVNAVLPEISKYFITLFKERNEESVINEINRFVLIAYQLMPNVAQFLIRFMAGLKVQRIQGRLPSWVSLPVVVFVQGYFNALEEAATLDKDKQLTLEDLKAAGHRVAASVRDATSDLGKKFDAAKVAAASITSPFTNSDGDDMSDTDDAPTAPGVSPVPPAGKKGPSIMDPSIMDRLSDFLGGFSAPAANMVRTAAFIGDRGEDIVQSVASAAFSAFVLLLIAVISVGVTLLLGGNATMMAIVIAANSVLLVALPLIGFFISRGRGRKIAEQLRAVEEHNPYDKAGNGFLEGGGLVLTIAFVGGASLPLIAFLCTVGAYHSFTWKYLVTGLVAIALGSLLLGLGDVGFDAVKALIRGVLPSKWEGEELKLKNRIARSFSRVGIAYCVFTLPIVFIGMMEHTLYTRFGASFPVLFVGLFLWFVDINATTAPDAQPVKRSRWGWVMALLSMMAPGLLLYSVNTFIFPLECPETDKSTEMVEECELPSYTDRLKDWYATPAGSGTSPGAAEVEASGVPNSCSAAVKNLVEQMEKDDCKVVLERGRDQQLIGLCKEAVECKALLSDGSRMRTVLFHKATPHDSGIGGWLSGWTVIGALVLLVVVFAIIGSMNPHGEKKKGAH